MRSSYRLWLFMSLAFFVFSMAKPDAHGQVPMQRQLKELADQEALDRLLEASESATRSNALSNLTARLTRAGLLPTVELSKGKFIGGLFADLAAYKAPVRFRTSSRFAAIVRGVGKALDTNEGRATKVCFKAPDGTSESLRTNDAGLQTLLSALSSKIVLKDIEPIPMHTVQVAGRAYQLSEANLGKALYKAIRKQAARGGDVTLKISPLPQLKPVRLTLQTTKGERLTFPVELDGAKQTLKLSPSARWSINGKRGSAKVDIKLSGQRVLLEALMRSGKLRLNTLERADYYPTMTWEPREDPMTYIDVKSELDYVFHLLGANNAWFDSVDYSVEPFVSVKRTAGDCGVVISFKARNKLYVGLGARPISLWKGLQRIKVVPASAPQPVVGYLRPPKCMSSSVGLTNKEFDRILTE